MTLTMLRRDYWLFLGLDLALALALGEGRWGFVLWVVAAMLVVAPKEQWLVGVGVPKGLEELVGCMWGYSGRLGKMGRVWGTPKSNGAVAKATTG